MPDSNFIQGHPPALQWEHYFYGVVLLLFFFTSTRLWSFTVGGRSMDSILAVLVVIMMAEACCRSTWSNAALLFWEFRRRVDYCISWRARSCIVIDWAIRCGGWWRPTLRSKLLRCVAAIARRVFMGKLLARLQNKKCLFVHAWNMAHISFAFCTWHNMWCMGIWLCSCNSMDMA